MLSESSPTNRDPSDCKLCPDWNDAEGRCRHPVQKRRAICGSDALRHEAAGRRTVFELYDDPVLAAAERALWQRAMAGPY